MCIFDRMVATVYVQLSKLASEKMYATLLNMNKNSHKKAQILSCLQFTFSGISSELSITTRMFK